MVKEEIQRQQQEGINEQWRLKPAAVVERTKTLMRRTAERERRHRVPGAP
jgi:hypothetical protein